MTGGVRRDHDRRSRDRMFWGLGVDHGRNACKADLAVSGLAFSTPAAGRARGRRRPDRAESGSPCGTRSSAAPLAALDLPLRVVVWEDGYQTKVSYAGLAPRSSAS